MPEADSCVECPKRTGHNTLLFEGMAAQHDSCTDPRCYAAKIEAHLRQTIAAKPKLVKISTAYGQPKDGGAIPRNRYVEIRQGKPQKEEQKDWLEYKSCKFTAEAIVTEGNEKGEIRRICANAECPVHHARKLKPATNATIKAEQEKRRREEAVAQVTGLRVLSAITEAIPVRLMKRDLLFVVERLGAVLDERRFAILSKQHNLGKLHATTSKPAKLLSAFIHKADEGTLGRLLVELAVLQAAASPNESGKVLRQAAEFYKVDVKAITAKVTQELAAKDKLKAAKTATPKQTAKGAKKPIAA